MEEPEEIDDEDFEEQESEVDHLHPSVSSNEKAGFPPPLSYWIYNAKKYSGMDRRSRGELALLQSVFHES